MQQQPDAWLPVERATIAPGTYLVTVLTDSGREVHVLEHNHKGQWIHEGEPTFRHGYFFRPIFYRATPAPCDLPYDSDD